ncbi:MAG: Peptidyl-prolyl cis-trans isomerase cyclophilin type, partial [Candidatus Levybacteria bacterium GW2011_GWA1_37_16]
MICIIRVLQVKFPFKINPPYGMGGCGIISFVGKIMMIVVLILLGLFVVFVINNNAAKPKPAAENIALGLPSTSPSPSQTQTLNLTPSSTASLSSQTSKADDISIATTAVIKTERGDIEITFYPKEAPNTIANFVSKAKSGFYDNLIFHRVEDWVIQGGDPDGNGTGGGKMATELNSKPFIVGSLGVARGGDIKISNDAQFFITKTDASWLNGQYTNFGIVTKGMDVV